jgi:hypothetical protein
MLVSGRSFEKKPVENHVEKGLKIGAKGRLTVEKSCWKDKRLLSTPLIHGFPPLSTPCPQPFPQGQVKFNRDPEGFSTDLRRLTTTTSGKI